MADILREMPTCAPPLGAALIAATTIATLAANAANAAPENAGPNKATAQLPFQMQTVARFDLPWAIAVIDADRLIVTTKPGQMFLADRAGGEPVEVSGLPKVEHAGQNGLLDVALTPDFSDSRRIYFTYVEPGDGGSSLALAHATLTEQQGKARLDGLGGDLAADAEGYGRPARRHHSLRTGWQVAVPQLRRSDASEDGARSGPRPRQGVAPDARRQACAGQPGGERRRRPRRDVVDRSS